jgi:hypothetical protein
MVRMFASPRVACSLAAGTAVALIAFPTVSASQALDPGWQLVYAGQPGYEDGLMESMFGDGTGQAIDARAYQPPASIYSEADPAAEPNAPVTAPIAQPPQPTPASAIPAPRAHSRRQAQAPTYYQAVPAPQAGTAGQGRPYYYRPAPAQFQAAAPSPPSGWRAVAPAPAQAQVDPRYVAALSSGQLRGSQVASPGSRMAAAPAAPSDPQFTGSVTAQAPRILQPVPANYRVAPAQPAQATAQSIAPAGA